jgi:multicomponent Na+:H+ antiporter subunit E
MTSLVLFAALTVFWFALSGRTDPLFLGMGLVSAGLVTALTQSFVKTVFRGATVPAGDLLRSAGRFGSYLVWLVGRMTVAGIQIAYFVLHPRMPLDPAIVRIPTALTSSLARTIVANTITLIPGTVTINIEEDAFIVHTYVPQAADDLVSGVLQDKVGAIFNEAPEPPITPTWEPPRRDEG